MDLSLLGSFLNNKDYIPKLQRFEQHKLAIWREVKEIHTSNVYECEWKV